MEIPFLLQQYKRFSQEKSLSEKAVDNKIYFGELTLYDSAGLVPWFNNGDEILGELLDLSFVDNKKEYKEKYDE